VSTVYIYTVVRTYGSGDVGCCVRNEVCIAGAYSTHRLQQPWQRDGPLSLYIRREIMK
jgi:hypothetical protein